MTDLPMGAPQLANAYARFLDGGVPRVCVPLRIRDYYPVHLRGSSPPIRRPLGPRVGDLPIPLSLPLVSN